MKLDGRFEPLMLVAQALTGIGLGIASGCALYWRHRARTAVPRMSAGYQAHVTQFTVTGPGPYCP